MNFSCLDYAQFPRRTFVFQFEEELARTCNTTVINDRKYIASIINHKVNLSDAPHN